MKRQPIAILRMATVRRISNFILRVRTIVVNMTNNAAIFVTPDPPLATVTSDNDDLEDAEAVAETRVAGSAAARNVKRDIVMKDVRGLIRYVQKLADAAADEDEAIAIIQASGFDVKTHGARVKPDLEVKQGEASGSVHLIAKAVPKNKGRAMYEWQKSSDGAVWTTLYTTMGSRAIVNGIQPDSKVYFRVRAITREGAKVWSPVVSIIVA